MIIIAEAMVCTADDVYPVHPRGTTHHTMEEGVKCLEEGVAVV